MAVHAMARETHDADLDDGQSTPIQHRVAYSDGFGREIQHKQRAAPGPVPERDAAGRVRLADDGRPVMSAEASSVRWICSGWTVHDDKDRPVRSFEPFFSDTHRFEFDPRVGVASTIFYDPLGRPAATLHPDHSYEKVVFDAWSETRWDRNDTVLDDPREDRDVGGLIAASFADQVPWQTWHDSRAGGALGPAERRAAAKAAAHSGTPRTAHLDAIGRPFLEVERNALRHAGHPRDGLDEELIGRGELDVTGNVIEVRDAAGQGGEADVTGRGRVVLKQTYDLLGRRLRQESLDAGTRWFIAAVDGQSLRGWDERGHRTRTDYDALRRPLRQWVLGADPADSSREVMSERTVYGEQHPEAETRNLRGAVYLSLDSAGARSVERFDFKGNPLSSVQRLAADYRGVLDWSAVDAALPDSPAERLTERLDLEALEAALAPRLEAELFISETLYDALDRPTELRTPDASRTAPRYDEVGQLASVSVALSEEASSDDVVWRPFVTAIDYDAKGQRQRIDYGNGASTTYEYDPLTFRLTRLTTRRDPVAFASDCRDPPPDGWPGCGVQDLRYTYDPVGNVTHVADRAQQAVFFRNRRVEPDADYTYDALYRLVAASGREHLGQTAGARPHHHDDLPRVGLAHPGDGNAMAAYVEHYVYDSAGNMLTMRHRGTDPSAPGWTRQFTYAEAGGIEPSETSNRLTRADVGGSAEIFSSAGDGYDAHGNMHRLPHLAELHWDWRDRLRSIRRRVSGDGGERTFYVYDGDGQRTRGVTESATGEILRERLYLGGVEIERHHRGTRAGLVRETLHVMDGERRLALVETRVAGSDSSPPRLERYQLGNHLGSAVLELDAGARVVSYEEYTPYGSTSYQAVRGDVAAKRYRYTGKERDEETGFTYHGARYYAPWLARWISPDPAGLVDGPNLYQYVGSNPVVAVDSTGEQQEGVVTLETVPIVGNVEEARRTQRIADAFAADPAGVAEMAGIESPDDFFALQAYLVDAGYLDEPVVPDLRGSDLPRLEQGSPLEPDQVILEYRGQSMVTSREEIAVVQYLFGAEIKEGVQAYGVVSEPVDFGGWSPEAVREFDRLLRMDARFEADRHRIVQTLRDQIPGFGTSSAEPLPLHPSELPRAPGNKVSAGTATGPSTLSGYSLHLGGVPGVHNASMDVWARSFEIGHIHRGTGGIDRGVIGRFFASHAERQAYMMGTSLHVTVSRAPCADCQRWFEYEAVARRKSIRVYDPQYTWIFHGSQRRFWVVPTHLVNPHPVLRRGARR